MSVIKHKFIILFLFIFTSFASAEISQTKQLNKLFNKLSKSHNVNTDNLVEQEIWAVWHKHPKKISQLARRSILSSKASEGNLVIVEDFELDSHKTADFVRILAALELQNKKVTLLVTGLADNLDKAVRNLKNIHLVDAKKVSTYDLIDCEVLVIEKASVSILTEILSD